MIIVLLRLEKNIFFVRSYCEFIYKIKYYYLFPNDTQYTIYYKNKDRLTFDIVKIGKNTLATYIYEL